MKAIGLWIKNYNDNYSGETQAYTIGDIGEHRCVVTKLPLTGHSREAAIASGSSTTRLLGTFQVSFFSSPRSHLLKHCRALSMCSSLEWEAECPTTRTGVDT